MEKRKVSAKIPFNAVDYFTKYERAKHQIHCSLVIHDIFFTQVTAI
ncbi:MAG: hypothetical protein LBC03_02065 [Nitrososphaerota archaeon]|jgi:hypothetical protein|nr:hypothetical protein [Nitrososphaerota archaeon]